MEEQFICVNQFKVVSWYRSYHFMLVNYLKLTKTEKVMRYRVLLLSWTKQGEGLVTTDWPKKEQIKRVNISLTFHSNCILV